MLTGPDVSDDSEWHLERDRYLLETSVPGIFACGDVRSGPVKRVASAVGEGSMAITFVHQYLREQVPDRVIPWIIFALVVVPLVVVAFVTSRRRTVAGEHPAKEDARATALTEQEFAEAEAYEAKWLEKDREKHDKERLP